MASPTRSPRKVPGRRGSLINQTASNMGQLSPNAQSSRRAELEEAARKEEAKKAEAERDAQNQELQEVEAATNKARKRVRLQTSFEEYNGLLKTYFESNAHWHKLKIKHSQDAFSGSYTQWLESAEGQDLTAKKMATDHELERYRWYERQIKQLKGKFGDLAEDFRQLWKTSSIGFGLTLSSEERTTSEQSNFRASVMREYNVEQADADLIWCPISGTEYLSETVTAAHIFPHRGSQKWMTRIFGTKGELMHWRNAIPIAGFIEKFFDLGYIALVPCFPGRGSAKDVDDWQSGRIIRQYKIKIFAPLNSQKFERAVIPHSGIHAGKRIRQLDGAQVQFRNDTRPRARYLFYHYLFCMATYMTHNNTKERDAVFWNNIGQPVWGSHGRYMRRRYIMGLAAEFGHDLERLLENYADEADSDEDAHPRDPKILPDLFNAKIIANANPMSPEDLEEVEESLGHEDWEEAGPSSQKGKQALSAAKC